MYFWNPTRRTIIILPLVLILMFLLSTFIISEQDNDPVFSDFLPMKQDWEFKVYLLEENLRKVVPLKGSLVLWDFEALETEKFAGPLLLDPITESVQVLTQISAKPLGFGYTREEADSLFDPTSNFLNCTSENPEIIVMNSSLLINNCDQNTSFFALGSSPEEERFGRLPYDLIWKNLSESVDTEDREFVFVKCGKERRGMSMVKVNENAKERAENITKTIMKELGIEKKTRPMTVFLLIFDSLSRSHMYRNFNETLSFLNKSIEKNDLNSHFAVYDFIINHAQGENTIPNMIPLLFGYDYKYHKIRVKDFNYQSASDEAKFLEIQKDSLWKHFERMGFVTMFGFDIIWDFLVPAVGRSIDADHVFTNFWKASQGVFGTDNYINEHQCFGSHNSHWFMLKYMKEFIESYKGYNRFGYAHITTAHEKSGTIIKTVDGDLLPIVKDMLNYIKENNHDEDFVFIIAGDHGKHVSERDLIKPGWLENMLPAHLVITNQDLMTRMNAHDTFVHNSKRIASRSDWHLTLKHLSVLPYGQIYQDSVLYNHWKKITGNEFSVSLLLEKTNDLRSCEDLDIEDYLCVTLPYEEIDPVYLNDDSSLPTIIEKVSELAFETMNNVIDHDLCIELKPNELKYLAIRKIKKNYEIVRFRASVNQNPSVLFEIFASIYAASMENMYEKENFGDMPVIEVPNDVRGFKLKIQLLKVLRIDEFVGFMEEFDIVANQKPPFCVPQDPKLVTNITSELGNYYEQLFDKLEIRLSEFNSNCFETCKENDQVCQDWAFEFLTNPLILTQNWRNDTNYKIGGSPAHDVVGKNLDFAKDEFFGVFNNEVVLPVINVSCYDYQEDVHLICPCKILNH